VGTPAVKLKTNLPGSGPVIDIIAHCPQLQRKSLIIDYQPVCLYLLQLVNDRIGNLHRHFNRIQVNQSQQRLSTPDPFAHCGNSFSDNGIEGCGYLAPFNINLIKYYG